MYCKLFDVCSNSYCAKYHRKNLDTLPGLEDKLIHLKDKSQLDRFQQDVLESIIEVIVQEKEAADVQDL